MNKLTGFLPNEQATIDFANLFADLLDGSFNIYLKGEIGAGKTTFVRSFLRAVGVVGAIKSPTFSILESYQLQDQLIYHFDLYRITSPDELEYLDYREYLSIISLCFIEWPEHGGNLLPEPDFLLNLSCKGIGREFSLKANSLSARELLLQLEYRMG